MFNLIYSSLVQLNHLSDSLNKTYTKKISPQQIAKITAKLEEIRQICKKGFNPTTIGLKDDITKVLIALDKRLKFDSVSYFRDPTKKISYDPTNKIKEIRDQILLVRTGLEQASYIEKQIAPKIPLKIAFFCDVDVFDHNTAIHSNLKNALDQNIPFITSRSMLRCQGIQESSKRNRRELVIDLEKKILSQQNNWDIYGQNNEFVVFLPKTLLPEKNAEEKLKALDFVSDGSLKKISVIEAFQESRKKKHIHRFFKLFDQDPKIKKLFYLNGHGDATVVSALKKENFNEFLNFLEKQNCLGLIISSCASGGLSSLITIPSQSEEINKIPNFEDQARGHSFITIVQSIGDFPTLSNQPADENIHFLLEKISTFLESEKPKTLSQLRPIIEEVEGGKTKRRVNSIKVYFPTSQDAPGGFRPLGEKGLAYSLTHSEVIQKEILSQKSFLQDDNSAKIVIKNKDFLEIHPLIVKVPIIFKNSNSILMSMIPGKGHHFLQSITLDNQNPKDFIDICIQFHRRADVKEYKGFFISVINHPDPTKTFEDVAFMVSPTDSICTYKLNNQYFFSDGAAIKPITPLLHALVCQQIKGSTIPEPKAIRSISGGQDSEQLFKETYRDSKFASPLWDELNRILSLKDLSIETRMQLIDEMKLTTEEKQELLFVLMDFNLSDVALAYLKKEKLNLNAKSLFGIPLISRAIRSNKEELVSYLINEGANLNVSDPSKYENSPLHQAVILGKLEWVKSIIDKSSTLVNRENTLGWSPLLYTIPKYPEIFDFLISKGAQIDYVNKEGFSLLSLSTHFENLSNMEFLLNKKANPNVGKPSPLISAIQTNNEVAIKKLLEAGAKPFEKDESGYIPFVHAAQFSSPEIFKLFSRRKDCDFNVVDEKKFSALIAVLLSGNKEKIEILLNENISFPKDLELETRKLIHHILDRLEAAQDTDTLDQLRQINRAVSPDFESIVIDYFSKKKSSATV